MIDLKDSFGLPNISLRDDEKSGGYYLSLQGVEILDYGTHLKLIEGLQRYLAHYGKEVIDSKHEETARRLMRSLYIEKRPFKRSKNRSRSWVFRCATCDTKVDDSVWESDAYWYNPSTGENFCSEKCAEKSLGELPQYDSET